MAPVVECSNFSFSYGQHRILDQINFRVERGDWLTIIGPNGSGKSTLLKNILRLVEGGKSTGSMRIEDRPLETFSQVELARRIAYVPQAGGRPIPFTTLDFINLSRYPYGYHQAARSQGQSESVSEAMRLTNTTHLADRRMDALSGGQRQRVFLAAALAQNTNILLLDEPASFLDPRHVYTMNELLKYLHDEKGLTIITVTHDLNQPLDVGGLALVLRNSQQIYFGPSLDLASNGILDETFEHKFCYLEHPRTRKILVVA